jgi:cell division protease FtsH
MIIEQGMGTKLRDQVFHEDEGGMMMDRITREKPYSEKTAEEIDREINELIEEAAVRARAVIGENRKFLDNIKTALLEKETLDSDEVAKIFKGAKLPDSAKLY